MANLFDQALKITGLRSPLAALETLYLGATNPAFRKQVQGKQLTPEEVKSLASRKNLAIDQISQDPSQILRQAGADTVKMAAMAVPFGKGANVATKVLLPGAEVGIMGQAAEQLEENAFNPASLALSGVLGATTAGLTKVLGSGVQKAGQKAVEKGKDLAVKVLRPSPSQQRNFLKATGQTISDFLSKKNLLGAGFNKISAYVDKVQQQFDDIALKDNLPIDPNDIVAGFSDEIKRLSDSILPVDRQKAQTLNEIALNFIEKYGNKVLSSKQLTILRREIDDTVRDFASEGLVKSTQRSTRDVLQGAIRKAADRAGLKVGGKNLAQLGDELKNLYALLDIAEKQQFLGKGSLPLSLTQLLGGVGGGVIGGVPGILGGIAASNMINNPRVIGATSKLLQQAGGRMAQTQTPNIVAKLASLMSGGLVEPGKPNNNPNQQQPQLNLPQQNQQQINQPQDGFQTPPPIEGVSYSPILANDVNSDLPSFSGVGGNSGLPQDGQISPQGEWVFSAEQGDWVPNPQKFGQPQLGDMTDPNSINQALRVAALQDLQQTGGKNLTKIQAAMEMFKAPEPTDEQVQSQNLNSQIDFLEQLYKPGFKESLSMGDVTTGLGGLAAKGQREAKKRLDQDYQDRLTNYKQMQALAIGSINQARQAGVLNAGEAEQLLANMPNEYTSEAVAKEWFKNAKALLGRSANFMGGSVMNDALLMSQ